MTTFVLVHGAFGSAAELAPVIPHLEALGHRAIAVDLPCTDPAAMLDDYARSVVEAMSGIEGPVVVVGHSAGGATISLVPGRTRVDRLVYATAFVPEPGRSIVDIAGAQTRETILSISRDTATAAGRSTWSCSRRSCRRKSERRISPSSRPRSGPKAGQRWSSPGPGRRSPTCPAPTSSARRTTSCRRRHSVRWRRAWAWSPSSSHPTMRSSRSTRASSRRCWRGRPAGGVGRPPRPGLPGR